MSSSPTDYVPELIEKIIRDLEMLSRMGDWELEYLETEKLARAHGLMSEIVTKKYLSQSEK